MKYLTLLCLLLVTLSSSVKDDSRRLNILRVWGDGYAKGLSRGMDYRFRDKTELLDSANVDIERGLDSLNNAVWIK